MLHVAIVVLRSPQASSLTACLLQLRDAYFDVVITSLVDHAHVVCAFTLERRTDDINI